MANNVLLNSEKYRALKVKTGYSGSLGDNVMWAPTYPAEFRSVQADYPILFHKDASTGGFFPVALFGLEQGENLFLAEGDVWNATYVPLIIQRIPFSIGLYGEEKKRLINIDLDHPKVSETDGVRLFEEHGAPTEYLERISGMLEAIHVWNDHNKKFTEMLHDFDLLEPVTIDMTLDNGTQGQLMGFYTIHEDKLKTLDSEKLKELHKKEFLEPIYMVLASLINIQKLIERKSKRAR
ncbi:SapC family protein [Gilvimarinus polysaccharolyticus]|uniref:SapC family protein n=1 Tax=Gilvimarinus polysaccharolyticus TaxID=863921 RepID=UPI00067378D8|nr:SapC family protein [Gilvimarinus polysaccharolyticus]